MQNVCPLMSGKSNHLYQDDKPETLMNQFVGIECLKGRCAFWVNGFTTEHRSIDCCAFTFMALKNSEGQYRV